MENQISCGGCWGLIPVDKLICQDQVCHDKLREKYPLYNKDFDKLYE